MKRALLMAFGLVLATSFTAAAQTTSDPQGQKARPAFVDVNGDGICDNFQGGLRQGNGNGPGQGRGKRLGPQDGSGFGPGAGARVGGGGNCTGTCDGTGPKVRMRRGRGRG